MNFTAQLGILLAIAFSPGLLAQSRQQSAEPSMAAQEAAPADPQIVDLDTVTVSGTQPGPGLWRVAKGDHQLWLLGVLSPLPARMTWNPAVARARLAESHEVIWEPMFTINTDTGFFKSVYLGIQLYQATKNPDGKKLKDVLPADVYARWSRVKQQYMPRDRGVERKRPLLAADELFKAAIRRSGLSDKQVVQPVIRDGADDRDLKATVPRVNVTIADPRSALKEAKKISLQDQACLEATLDAIEQDLPRMVTNANAWSVGDIGRISFAQIERRDRLCSDAFSGAEFTRKLGIPDIRESSRTEWMKAAEKALSTNTGSFSVVPLQDILGQDGYAARLSAKGYVVDPP